MPPSGGGILPDLPSSIFSGGTSKTRANMANRLASIPIIHFMLHRLAF